MHCKKLDITLIEDNMIENQLRWFGHVQVRPYVHKLEVRNS